jgi:hypothetical protein
VQTANLNGRRSDQQKFDSKNRSAATSQRGSVDYGRSPPACGSGCHHARKGVQGIMQRFLQLHALAATRGNGLRPELRDLLERLAEAQKATLSVAITDNCHLANPIDPSSRMTPIRGAFGELDPLQPWKA